MLSADITKPEVIERQARMSGLGLSLSMIAKIMAATDDEIAKNIGIAEAAILTMTGAKKESAEQILQAFCIERDLRA
jgi:hypothetical protein